MYLGHKVMQILVGEYMIVIGGGLSSIRAAYLYMKEHDKTVIVDALEMRPAWICNRESAQGVLF